MSPKQWFALLGFYISYLFFGASIFHHMEHQLETERRENALIARIDINELLTAYTAPYDVELQNDILNKVSDYCEKPVTNYTKDTFVDPYVWNFFHSFFFSFTVCSTVGYGNISPNNTVGRMFMIFYALIGIPVNGILFAYLGEFFGTTFVRLYRRYKQYKVSTNVNYVPRKLNLIAQIALYLTPGLVIFIFLPACLFTLFEDWPFSISVYYAFVTLTTIGFGDFVVTFQPHQEREFGVYFVMYQIFIIFWVIFGLGYLVMIMGFIARGMRSKRVAKLEHTLAMNIKQAQNRIWNNVSKDVGYLRKILNEVYMLRFKPVYHEPGEFLVNDVRSASCPDLTIYRSGSYLPKRRRAFSECYVSESNGEISNAMSTMSMIRVQSDSDLARIDKKRTFESVNGFVQPSELLAKVVTALGNFRAEDDGQSLLEIAVSNRGSLSGVQGFSDSQILSSERRGSGWSLHSSENTGPMKMRERATSAFGIPVPYQNQRNANEWTWSGSNSQIKELMKMRQKQTGKEDLYRASFGTDRGDPQQFTINVPEIQLPSATNKTLLDRLNPFRRSRKPDISESSKPKDGEFVPPKYTDSLNNRRDSKISLSARQYMSQTRSGRPSVYTLSPQQAESDQSLLETTTIADLIRAIELVHTNSSIENSEPQSNYNSLTQPRRKMGTASLTPPKVPSIMTLFPPNFDGHALTNQNANANIMDRRRGSLRPTIFNSIRHNQGRRQSSAILPISRNELPPPYTPKSDSPALAKRRFSVRPSNLAIPPGQAPAPPLPLPPSQLAIPPSVQISSAVQRKLSTKPTPLNRLTPQNASARNILWRTKQLQLDEMGGSTTTTPSEFRGRHSSLSNIYEKRATQQGRERNDSK